MELSGTAPALREHHDGLPRRTVRRTCGPFARPINHARRCACVLPDVPSERGIFERLGCGARILRGIRILASRALIASRPETTGKVSGRQKTLGSGGANVAGYYGGKTSGCL